MEIKRVLTRVGGWLRVRGKQSRAAGAAPEPQREWPTGLPETVRHLVGRGPQIRLLDQLVGDEIVAVTGPRGVGKTALVTWWAKRAKSRFPHGCLYADLNGTVGQVEAVLTGFLQKLGVSLEPTVPGELPGLFQLVTETKRVLVVLDNAASAAQVRALLPARGNGVVVTSRVPLPEFRGTTLALEPLTFAEARRLLAVLGGMARVADDPEATRRVIGLCDRLPLPLRIAGDQLAAREQLTMTELADELDVAGSSSRVSVRIDVHAGVSAAMDAGYRMLSPAAAKTFRLLGTQPCPALHLFAVAALTGTDVVLARQALGELLRYGFVELADNRIKLGSTLRDYAAEQAGPDEVADARKRLLRWYIAAAAKAGDTLVPGWAGSAIEVDARDLTLPVFSGNDDRAPLSWFELEFPSALALLHDAEDEAAEAWKLPAFYLPHLFLTKHWRSCLEFTQSAVKIARELGDKVAIARSLLGFSWVLHELDRDREALPDLEEAMRLHEGIDDPRGRAWTGHVIGEVLTALGRHPEARDHLDAATAYFREAGWPFGIAIVLASKARTLEQEGWLDPAFAAAREALQISSELGILPLESRSHHHLGQLHQRDRNPRAAIEHFEKALELRRAMGERWGEADSLLSLAETLAELGRLVEARASFDESLAIFTELHDPRVLVVHAARANLDVAPKPKDPEG
ncbi:tetratricopeptide repeat protein [Amycolatopsis acidiphila]|uniref:Tetratricopeptide repeat protein n=1 Tax=Amycolatopsis acidiphila TaxID=715473 RepID=A0A557ZZ69_9PSEU|nr:tetratricopeptide repeat protein [Amycolatopsis acidiphila]TVT17300.1 tetratricopeptide repeat protein [Amycolatopsis acidiphila]UIJ61457.1 tetratricopeptide repeat protein [Amycolatopsis acidiphila]GHG59813.1 hypothetical protein GCM10017788_13560 [Amycolatopsis acidiphila]